MKQNFAGDTVH